MKKLLLIFTFFAALTVSAQRVIENPTFGAKGLVGLSLGIEKVVLQKDMTKLYMVYYHGGGFNMSNTTRLVANGKEYKVQSAEGIELNGSFIQKPQGEHSRFVLNFPPLDKGVDRFDFIEDYCDQCFKIFDVALTRKAAADIETKRNAEVVPTFLINYAANINDNGKSLEQEEFTMEPAIVKGKIYNYNPQVLGGQANMVAEVNIENPFLGRETVAVELNPDHTFELKVPMIVKHQVAWLRLEPFYSDLVVLAAGKTIEVSVDFNEMFSKSGQQSGLTPYFAGENVDLNYALNLPFFRGFQTELVYNDDTLRKVAAFTMLEFKQYILDGCERYSKMVDTMHITKRAKDFMKLMLKYNSAEILSRAYRNLPMWREKFNITIDNSKSNYNDQKSYYDYPKILDIDHIMMFYTYDMCQVFNLWNWIWGSMMFRERVWNATSNYYKAFILDKMANEGQLSEKEMFISAAIVEKIREQDSTRTNEEIAFLTKYNAIITEYVEEEKQRAVEDWKTASGGEGFFYDFSKLYSIGYNYILKGIPVPDSLVSEVEKMSRPFYSQYIKAKNAEIKAKIEEENARGGYYTHQPGESVADSLLVELLKGNQGKVVLIDVWNTWCGPCRGAMKEMEPMKAEFEGKDVAFVYVADTSSPVEEYNTVIPTVKGQHHRLPERDVDALKRKWGFSGIPAYVLIGKDGTVKDYAGHGTEYFRLKIDEELNK